MRHIISIAFLTVLISFPLAAHAQDCTNPDEALGTIVYNTSYDVFQGCTERGWMAFHPTPGDCTLDGQNVPHGQSHTFYSETEHADCPSVSQERTCTNGTLDGDPSFQYASCEAPSGPTGCDNIGDQCSDGSYYIGQIGGNDIYATAAASEVSRTWNKGTFNPPWTTTGCNSWTDGQANTTCLVNTSDAGAPYEAAEYCNGLEDVHGHSDWYLPAQDELHLFWNEGTPVAGVNTGGSWYWSSTEISSSFAWFHRFNDGDELGGQKNTNRLVRCVRH